VACLLLAATQTGAWAADGVTMTVTDRYKYYDGKQVGRLVQMSAKDSLTTASLREGEEWKALPLKSLGSGQYELLLPDPIGVESNDTVNLKLCRGKKVIAEESLAVAQMRHWNILFFHHSHVDIGYTHTQQVVEFIHRQNIDQAIELAEKTKDYPDDARFRWNTEVSWPMERYLAGASKEKRERVLDAIRKGYVSVDNSYLNTNSTAAHEPELMELYAAARRINKLTGKDTQTMVQVDIPGFTWGLPAIAALTGVKSIISLPNGGDRTGRAHELDCKPRYWVGPDGKSKVLYIQPGGYILGCCDAKRGSFFFKNLGVKDTTLLPKTVGTGRPRELFIDDHLRQFLPRLENDKEYVYDVCVLPWCVSDNVPIDNDLPDAVKSWNEEFAYPHLRISNSSEIVAAFEKYADKIPTVSGDYSEYWTDGLGTSALHTGHHREVKERLMQAEILSCMTGNAIPGEEVSEAWRYALLGTEHTWAYIWPNQPISDEILDVKYGYFHKTDSLGQDLMKRSLPTSETGQVYAVFNTEDTERDGLVKVSADERGKCNAVKDAETGEMLSSQLLKDGSIAFIARKVPAFGCKKYKLLTDVKAKANRMVLAPKIGVEGLVNNGKVSVCIDPYTGDIVSMVTEGREFINRKLNVNANSFRYLRGGQATAYATKPYNVILEWEEYGPVMKTLLVTSKADGCNSLTRRVTLLEGDGAVYIDNIVDKIATTDKEGVHFGFSFDMGENLRFTADVPWGVMELEKDQWPQANRNWMAMQRWVNLSDDEANVTLCSLNAPIFEVGDMTANILGSSGNWISHIDRVPTLWSWAMNNHWHTNFRLAQDGQIHYGYILRPALGPVDVTASSRFAQTGCRPLIANRVNEDYEMKAPFSIQAAASVTVSCVRPIEGGNAMLVMLHSLSENPETVRFTLAEGRKACAADAWGTPLGEKGLSYEVPARGVKIVRIDK